MKRCSGWITATACLLLCAAACGDDETALGSDAGSDSGPDARPRAGAGGAGSRAGTGGAASDADSGSQPDDGSDAGVSGEAQRRVTLRFEGKVGSERFACGQYYPGQGSSQVRVTPRDFRFFVSDVRLVSRDGSEVPLRLDARPPYQNQAVALIDFTNEDGECSGSDASRSTIITGSLPPGDYTGVTFSNAVPNELNHLNISEAAAPLQDASTYWGWAGGYRFIMAAVGSAEPASDSEGADGGSELELGATFLHVGAGGCSGVNGQSFQCARPNRNRVKLEGFAPDTSAIVADLGAVFASVDLRTPVECHGSEPRCAPSYQALGLSPRGEALDTQSVFRVE